MAFSSSKVYQCACGYRSVGWIDKGVWDVKDALDMLRGKHPRAMELVSITHSPVKYQQGTSLVVTVLARESLRKD